MPAAPLVVAAGACLTVLATVASAQGQVIDRVTVIDVAAGAARAEQRVVIEGRRITAAGPAAQVPIPAGTVVLDGRGKFLIPGLWDMHVHLPGADSETHALTLFLANGVTGVRDMSTGIDALLRWRSATAEGTTPGPRVLGAGMLVDGLPHVYPAFMTFPVTTPAEARHAVDSLVRRGVDFIKAYEMLRADVFAALADQARARGIPLAGHLPLAVSADDAVRAGLRSFEHLRNMEVSCSSKADSLRAVAVAMLDAGKDQPGMALRSSIHTALRARAYETFDEARCDALIRLMAEHGTWHDANLVLGTQLAFRHDTTTRFQRWVPYLAPAQRSSFTRPSGPPGRGAGRGGLPRDEVLRRAEWALRLVKRMHDAGIRLLPGTDWPNAAMVPGAALHEELALFVRAGLTPAQSLRTATLNPAVYLGLADSLGTIDAGKVADLVLLDADPLQDIRRVSQVNTVWRAGQRFDRARLDAMLDGLAKAGR